MTKCKYLIEGELYDSSTNLQQVILELAATHNLTAELEPTENGFWVEIEAEIERLLDFEPLLFKKVARYMEIKLYTKKKPIIKEVISNATDEDIKTFKLTAQHLRQEKVIAIKGNNSYHIVCNASKAKAVQAMRAMINEPQKPLYVMYKNFIRAEQLIALSKKEEELLDLPEKPIVITKLKNLHRLEKVRIKHKLTPMITPVNNRIGLSLIHNELYEKLFSLIEFPLVNIDALDNEGKIIHTKAKLQEVYGDKLAFILEDDGEITQPREREVLQIVYGKTQHIVTAPKPNKNCVINLSYKESHIFDRILKPLKLLPNDQPKFSALALLFSSMALEKVLQLDLPFERKEIEELYKTWETSTTTSTSLLTLFDAIASLSGELHEKTFMEQSIMLTESHYEVCEEDTFDFEIKNNEIEIDILSTYEKNSKLKHLGSTLVNTVSSIIAELAQEDSLENALLCGELFYFRDLSELTIEKLEDEGIKATLN